MEWHISTNMSPPRENISTLCAHDRSPSHTSRDCITALNCRAFVSGTVRQVLFHERHDTLRQRDVFDLRPFEDFEDFEGVYRERPTETGCLQDIDGGEQHTADNFSRHDVKRCLYEVNRKEDNRNV